MAIKLMIKYSIRPEIDLRVGATIIDIITLGRLTEIDLSQLSKVQSRNLKKGKSSGFQPAPCPLNGLNRKFAFYAYKTEHSVVP